MDKTPGTSVISKSTHDITVKCTEAGYLETSETLATGGSTSSTRNIGFGALGAVMGLIVNAASGAISQYPDNIQVTLIPASFATAQDRDRFIDARVAKRETKFGTARQRLEGQSRARGADLCNMRGKKLSEIREEVLAALEEKRQAVVVENPEPRRDQTIKLEQIEFPSLGTSEQTEIAALPPVKQRQEVEAHLNRNKSGFQRKLSSYNERHRVLVGDYGLAEITRISSQEVKRLDGEVVVLEVSLEVGQPGYRTAGCGTFELRWVGADLEFIGSRSGST